MELTDLMIGNYVNGVYIDDETDEKKKSFCEVLILDEPNNYISVDSSDRIEEFEEFEGIPITEEWFKKFHPACHIHGNNIVIDRFKLIWKNSYNYWYVVDYGRSVYLTKIEFVHEWQNFYKAMNRKELKID